MAIGSTLSRPRSTGFRQPLDRPSVQLPPGQTPPPGTQFFDGPEAVLRPAQPTLLQPTPLRPPLQVPGPTVAPPRTLPQVAGAQVTAIQPGTNDLRGTQIAPVASPRLQTTQGQVEAAQQGLVNFPGFTSFQGPADTTTGPANALLQEAVGVARTPRAAILPGAADEAQARSLATEAAGQGLGVGGFSPAADVTRARALALQNLDAETPSRTDLARRAFDLFSGQQDELRRQRLQEAGQNAARFGRIGAGLTTSTLNDLEREFDLNRLREGERLALDAAGQELQDRLNRAGAAQGLAGTFGGLDLNAAQVNASNALNAGRFGLDAASTVANLGRGFRNEARDERGFQAALDRDRAGFLAGAGDTTFGRGLTTRGEARADQGLAFDREQATLAARRALLGDVAGLEGQQFGQERAGREELRGERGFQEDLNREAIDRAVQQRLLEETLLDRETGRQRGELDDLARIGFGGRDPTGVLLDETGRLDRQASQNEQALADALAAVGQSQTRIAPPPPGFDRLRPENVPAIRSPLPPVPRFAPPRVASPAGIDFSQLTREERLALGLPVTR